MQRRDTIQHHAMREAVGATVTEVNGHLLLVGIPTSLAGPPGCERLTASERAVAGLAAPGVRNSEIARARRSSTRTVANQLASVYRKLGVSGRGELAALLGGARL
jgi:DNA-binding NarL/FixJ family response regulator